MSNGHLAASAVAKGTRSAPCAWIAARVGSRPPGWTAGIRATGTPAPQALGVDTAAGSTTARVHASTACRPAESVPTSRARRSAFSQDATTTSIPAARSATTSSLTKLPLPGSSWDGYHRATTRMRRGQASPGEPGEIDEAGGSELLMARRQRITCVPPGRPAADDLLRWGACSSGPSSGSVAAGSADHLEADHR